MHVGASPSAFVCCRLLARSEHTGVQIGAPKHVQPCPTCLPLRACSWALLLLLPLLEWVSLFKGLPGVVRACAHHVRVHELDSGRKTLALVCWTHRALLCSGSSCIALAAFWISRS